jgi:hypothetical protein
VQCIKQAVRSSTTDRLCPVAAALGDGRLEKAQLQAGNTLGQILLAGIKSEVALELGQRIAPEVEKIVKEAAALPAGATSSSTPISDLCVARDRAATLALRAGLPTAFDSGRVVFEQLSRLEPEDRAALLARLSCDDLVWLSEAGAKLVSSGAKLVSSDAKLVSSGARDRVVDTLLQASTAGRNRPDCLGKIFAAQAERFFAACNLPSGSSAAGGLMVREVSEMAATFTELKKYAGPRGISNQAVVPLSLENVRASIGRLAQSPSADSAGVVLSELSPSQALVLAAGLNALGGRADLSLPSQQPKCVDAQSANYQQQMSTVLEQLVAGKNPHALLRALASLEQASVGLKAAVAAFHAPEQGPAEAGRTAETAQMTRCLSDMPIPQREALSRALSHRSCQALISALHTGAELAAEARDAPLGARLSGMASLLGRIFTEAGQLAPDSPIDHPRFAAKKLTDKARDAFLELYELSLPKNASARLLSSRFTPSQTRRMQGSFESPASDYERKLTHVDALAIPSQFFEDARRRFLYCISGEPIIDSATWPDADDAEQRARRIGAGYQNLITLCGSEEQARNLMMYAHQGAIASFNATCQDPDSPSRLPDGTAGWMGTSGDKTDQRAEFHFSIGPSGRPRFDVHYQLKGAGTFAATGAALSIVLLKAESYLRAHFSGELQDDGTMALLEPPSYTFHGVPDGQPV